MKSTLLLLTLTFLLPNSHGLAQVPDEPTPVPVEEPGGTDGCDKLRQQLAAFERQIANLKDRIENQRKLIERIEKQIKEAEDVLKQLNEALTEAVNAYVDAYVALHRAIRNGAPQEEIDRLRKAAEAAEKRMTEINAAIDKQQEAIVRLRLLLQEQQFELIGMLLDLFGLQAKAAALRDTINKACGGGPVGDPVPTPDPIGGDN